MAQLKYTKPTKISLKLSPEYNEVWLQGIIASDPSIIGLGELILKDQERLQEGGGRLDLLFQDPDENLRYEVELQLGKTDESHIIRTIEYWDIERRRYPQFDHTAVIIAEDITSRFLNVIGLFNGVIPIIAIQLNAVKIDDKISLVFTTIIDRRTLGTDDEDSFIETTNRDYWERRGTKATVQMADDLLEHVKKDDPSLELKYNKFYIGLVKEGKPFNFIIIRPQKTALRLELRLKQSDEIDEKIHQAGIEILEYSHRHSMYKIRLTHSDISKNSDLIANIIHQSYLTFGGSPND